MEEKAYLQKAGAHFVWSPAGPTGPIITEGQGAIVRDLKGREYIDCLAGPGVLSVGHCHPRVVEAGTRQLARLTQGTGTLSGVPALNIPMIELAEKLARITPESLTKVFFCNSGGEANDGAIKFAKKYLAKQGKDGVGMVALERGFHGRLALPLSLSGRANMKSGLGSYCVFPGIIHIPAPYCYRCDLNYPQCKLDCAEALVRAIEWRAPGAVSIFICEPMPAVAGMIIPPPEYLPRIMEICKDHGVVVILDEVYTGFGRTGRMFAYEHWGCVPDIMTVAKAVGGGLPLGAIIFTDEIADAMEPMDHYTTFGGNNALPPATGLAAIEVIEEEGLVQRAEQLGNYLLGRLEELKEQSAIVGDVRGKGLFIGVEVVHDKQEKTPGGDLAEEIRRRMQDRGVLVSMHGDERCVIRFTPPLIITKEQIAQVFEVFKDSLGEVERQAHT